MGEAKRRQQYRRALEEQTGADAGLIDHMLDRQVAPQVRARELRALGLDVGATFVSTDPAAAGYEVTCEGCGRTARMASPLPAGVVARCPDCRV